MDNEHHHHPGPSETDSRVGDRKTGGSGSRFSVEGMHCTGCATGLQSSIAALPGVEAARVDFITGSAEVHGEVSAETVLRSISDGGFKGGVLAPAFDLQETRTRLEQAQSSSVRLWRRRAIVGLGLWVPLETLHWTLGGAGHAWMPWVMFLGSAIVLVVAGGGFYASAWKAALRGGTNMDTLVSIGASTAFIWSFVVFVMQQSAAGAESVWTDRPLYFAEAAALLGVISLGHWLEAAASVRAGAAVRDLLELQPDEAERLGPDDTVELVASRDLEIGDHLQVRPGGRVPVDGTVIDGRSEIDESLVTGEPLPVNRAGGDPVIAGTVNGSGRLVIEATVDGRHTTVARIAELVQGAQSSQAPIQRLADRVSAVFVPTVISIAAASVLGWGLLAADWQTGIVSAVTVLIISCPCALGLATPMAVMVGAGEASRRGILVKSAGDLEAAGRLERVFFDKTGTLTAGRPILGPVTLLPEAEATGLDRREVLRLAAAAERGSEHPLGRALVSAAAAEKIESPPVSDFTAIPGRGVQARVDGRRIEVIRDERATCRVVVDDHAVATLDLVDEPRPDAAEAIDRIRDMGLEVIMLTGDRQTAAEEIGGRIGLHDSEIIADASPESKLEAIAAAGPHTAMVGDGINDAAALARADLGIAMAGGTGTAIESAGGVVPADRVSSVADAVHLARRTLLTIRQNLFLAFLYNSLAIPAAAFGLLGASGPLIAAAAMACSDVSVIGNAIRLRRSLARERRTTSGERVDG
ncbi:MAG: hypothetical protein CMJ51_05080 [Planctomycetaceae bacterium]|nr:hypothetical protein [Planctomycetaceae bacterium]